MLERTRPRRRGILANHARPEMQGSIVPASLGACARKVCSDVQRAVLACLRPRLPRKQIACRRCRRWHPRAPVVISSVRGCSKARSLPGIRRDLWWNEATTNALQAPRPMGRVGQRSHSSAARGRERTRLVGKTLFCFVHELGYLQDFSCISLVFTDSDCVSVCLSVFFMIRSPVINSPLWCTALGSCSPQRRR